MVLGYDGTLNRYFDYAVQFGIRSIRKHQSWNDDEGWTVEELRDADIIPVKIPAYQRKLVWTEEQIEKILTSPGRLLGNITFAGEELPGNRTGYVLVDGLQRFSAITAIIRSLWNNVLQQDATYPGAIEYFSRLKNQITPSQPAIAEHNHNMLLSNNRVGIRDSYKRLSDDVEKYIVSILKVKSKIPDFAEKVTRTMLDKRLIIDVYSGFSNPQEIIDTFMDINSSGVKLSNTDLLRAGIINQAEEMEWSEKDMSEIENRFTLTLQPENDSKFNKDYRNVFGLRLYQAFKSDPKNIFPDWDKLPPKSLDILFNYIDGVEEAQKQKVSLTEYKWPYLEEIFRCGSLPFIAFVWFFFHNHYLKFLEKKQEISNILKDRYVHEERSNGNHESDTERSESINKIVKIRVEETLEKLENAIEKIEELTQKLETPKITDRRKKKLETELKEYEEIRSEFPDFYADLPDFLGGTLTTVEDGLLFVRSAYRRLINGDIGKTAPIIDELMNTPTTTDLKSQITTIKQLATTFNPEDTAGKLQNPPNEDWLKGRLLAKAGTTMAKIYFNVCLLPNRDSGLTKFNVFIYGSAAGQWNIDHLIPKMYINPGEGASEGNKIVNFAPLDKDHNNLARTVECSEKISNSGASAMYYQIMEEHPYCKWLVEEHYIDHKDNPKVGGEHQLDKQECLVHNHASKIGDQRLDKIVELLIPKL